MASKPANDSQGNQNLDECNQDALKAHNDLRAKHGVPPVTLAKVILRIYLFDMDISIVLVPSIFCLLAFLTTLNIHSALNKNRAIKNITYVGSSRLRSKMGRTYG